MQPYQIVLAKKPWNGCDDARPWVVIGEWRPNFRDCFPISTKHYSGGMFCIESGHPDFFKTGLSQTSFVHYDSIVEVSVGAIVSVKGYLDGEMLQRFLSDAGLE